ncbi:hypothetical protein NDU88_008274 [Pleurodeles waltl]|uniref:Uncharacterized protein n=1 Tax=Pleurodeles waltl TaxID=8319 RepID=A0AAV7PVR4_PLEWA|nr:hypothetical protein NDU88_008274 [Pleurodeles waltl]
MWSRPPRRERSRFALSRGRPGGLLGSRLRCAGGPDRRWRPGSRTDGSARWAAWELLIAGRRLGAFEAASVEATH